MSPRISLRASLTAIGASLLICASAGIVNARSESPATVPGAPAATTFAVGPSIRASHDVVAGGFAANSDARIKCIVDPSDGSHDLKSLMGIQITDYTFKDAISKGSNPQGKVIALQT